MKAHQRRIYVYCPGCKWTGYKTQLPDADGFTPCPRCKSDVKASRRHEERRFKKAKVDLGKFT